jgi:hypothetical protein
MEKTTNLTISGDVSKSFVASTIHGNVSTHNRKQETTNYNGMSKEDIIATMAKTSENHAKNLDRIKIVHVNLLIMYLF